jgi:carbon monoxide dehydrogenase subunit G
LDFTGRYVIPAAPGDVWTALHDPEVLAACIPGCHGVTRLSETVYEAKATLKVGPLKATFTGKVTWADAPVPEGFSHAGVLSGEGQGGAVGFARGNSQILLAPENGGTALSYNAKATIGGKLAQIGQRLIDASAKAVADEFFSKFDALMRARSAPPPAQPPPAVATETADGTKSRNVSWILAIGGVLILGLLAYWLL